MAWDFVMSFARDNNLVVVEPRSSVEPRSLKQKGLAMRALLLESAIRQSQ